MILELTPNAERSLKETCNAIHHFIHRYGETEVPEYLENNLNFFFKLPEMTRYNLIAKGSYLIIENERVRIEFTHGDSFIKSILKIEVKELAG